MLRNGRPQSSKFTLDASGVAGLFGGDVAVSAMATVHVYEGRKWWGWYNSPGSYEIGKRYGQLAKSRFWDGIYPGPNVNPAVLFGLDGTKGPKYRAALSGTVISKTGHLGHLFLQECKEMKPEVEIEGRRTTPVGVTIAELPYQPACLEYPNSLPRMYSTLAATIPIAVSVGTCVACAAFRDWYSFSMILLGIVSSGLSCLVIGTGRFTFDHPDHAQGSPRGDGFLEGEHDLVILKGEEGAVNSITRGKFSLRFASEPQYNNIGLCSMLLVAQFLAQLLLVPQGKLSGQIMFVTSLAVSWMYNSYLSSLEEKIQRDILINEVLARPILRKFQLGTRTAMAVFVMLVLRPVNLEEQLEDLIPNKTAVWRRWRETVAQKITDGEKLGFDQVDWKMEDGSLTPEEITLLGTLFKDAQAAFAGYMKYCSPYQRSSAGSAYAKY